MPAPFRANGVRPRAEVRREADQRRGSARARGYTTAWDKASAGHLRNNPLCKYCDLGAWGDAPRVTAATLVDHLIPHNGDQAIFWNKRDWVSSCAPCHNGPKQRTERRGLAALEALAARIGHRPPTPGG